MIELKTFTFCLIIFTSSLTVNGRRHGPGGKHSENPVEAHLYPKASGYQRHVMPPTQDGPLNVEINTYIRELGPVVPQDNSFRIQLTFRQKFLDPRLSFSGDKNYINILGEEVKHIWSPDTFIRNERLSTLHGTIHPNIYARIYPNGEVLMSEKITVIASCPNLEKNLRTEGAATCNLDIASYGLTEELISYTWQSGPDAVKFGDDTASFLGEEIILRDFSTDKCQATTATGTYTCLRIRFVFAKANTVEHH